MKRSTGTMVCIALAVASAPAHTLANEESVLLTNQALVQLDTGNTTTALQQLRAAVAADPNDEDARYYLAHTYSLVGEYKKTLEVLGTHRFEYWDADYLRGVAHLSMGNRDAAATAFAASAAAGNPRAKFYQGLIHYQRGNMAEAKLAFRSAGPLDADLEPYRRLYYGLILKGEGKDADAQRYFDSLQKDAPDSPAAELAREASAIQAADIDTSETQGSDKKAKYVFFDLRLSEELDTNPGLVQSDDNLARIYHPNLTETTGALRTGLYLALRGRWGKREGFGGHLGASGYATLHAGNPEAKEFNVLQPRAFLTLSYTKAKWSIVTPVSYARTYLGPARGLDLYNEVIAAGTSFGYSFKPKLSLHSGLYFENHNFGDGQDRNGFNLAVPIEVVSPLHKKLRLSGGYTLSTFIAKTSNSPWQYLGNRLHTGLLAAPHKDVLLFGTLAYFNRQYANDWPDPALGQIARSDNELSIELGGRYHMSEYTDITVTYDGTFQESIETFTYRRHVVGVSLGFAL